MRLICFVDVPMLFVAEMFMEYWPSVRFPVMRPVEVFMDVPSGRLEAL